MYGKYEIKLQEQLGKLIWHIIGMSRSLFKVFSGIHILILTSCGDELYIYFTEIKDV